MTGTVNDDTLTAPRRGTALLIALAFGVALLCSGWCSAQEYGGSLKHGDTILRRLMGGLLLVTPDTPITVTAFHPHGLNELWVEVARLKKERVARSSTGPTTLGGTFTLREKFQITKAGRYSLTARGYQLPVPGAKPAKCLGPRPFYFVKATLDVIVPESASPTDPEGKQRDGWESSGPGATFAALDWQMVRASFNSGPYRHLAVLLINSANAPLAWFDDIEIEGLQIVNPGFEEHSAPDEFPGWEGRLWLPWDAKYHTLKEPLHMFASPEYHSGKTSLQLTAPPRDAFIVRQRVACKPDTDYSVRCWVRSTGSGRLELHGLRENEALENVLSSTEVGQTLKPCVDHLLVGLAAPARPRGSNLGDNIIEIREPSAKMSKRFLVGSHKRFRVTFDVTTHSGQDGSSREGSAVPEGAEETIGVVRAVDPDGALLAQTTTSRLNKSGNVRVLEGFAGPSGKVIIEVTKTGPGVVRVANVGVREKAQGPVLKPKQIEQTLQIVMRSNKPRALMGMYDEEDLARALDNLERYGWARRIRDSIVAEADFWAAKSDEELYSLIPAENPRALVVSYNDGCPIHGGDRFAFHTSLEDFPRWQCAYGKEWWYSGAQITNPGTGEKVVVQDDGFGWVAPEGFLRPGTRYYFTGAARIWILGTLLSYPYKPALPGKKSPPCLRPLALAYALTGKDIYAHKTLLVLNRLAECYRHYNGTADIGHPAFIAEWSTTEWSYINAVCDAYDLTFDAIECDRELLRFFAARGDADYNNDDQVTAEDLRHNLQRNLIGYMAAFSRFMVDTQSSDWQLYYIGCLTRIAKVLGNGQLMHEAIDGPRGYRRELLNAFYPDGKHWYHSIGYSRSKPRRMAEIAESAHGFSDPEHYPQPLDLYNDTHSTVAGLLSYPSAIDCEGSYPGYGDVCPRGGPGKVGPPPYRLMDETALVRLPRQRDRIARNLSRCGNVNARRKSPWVLFHSADFAPPTGPESDTRRSPSHLLPASQIAILRHGWERGQQTHFTLQFSPNTGSHTHNDTLALLVLFRGWALTPCVGYWRDAHQKFSGAWMKNAANHCLVTADNANQTGKLGTGRFEAYAALRTFALADASTIGVYPASRYRRTLAMVPLTDNRAYAVDVFRIKGDHRQHDYLFHALSDDAAENFRLEFPDASVDLKPQPGTLAGPDVQYMEAPGLGWVKDVEHAAYDGPFQATWQVAARPEMALHLHMPRLPGRQLYVGRGEGGGVFGKSPFDRYVDARLAVKPGQGTTFVAAIEPSWTEPQVQAVEMMSVTSSQPEHDPVAVRVTTAQGHDYLYCALDSETEAEARLGDMSFRFRGQAGHFRMRDGRLLSAAVVGTSRLEVPGVHFTLHGPAQRRGTVVSVDVASNCFVLEAPTPWPTGTLMRGLAGVIRYPHAPKSLPTVYVIDRVESAGEGRFRVYVADPPSLTIALCPVRGLDAAVGTATVTRGILAQTAALYLDGKHIAREGIDPNRAVAITAAAGDVLHLAEPSGEALQAEDLAAVYSVGRGDEFVVQTVAEVRRDATDRAMLWAPGAFTARLGDETLPAEAD